MGSEAEVFLKRIGDIVSVKWGKSYSEVMGWIRGQMSLAIVRASVVYLQALARVYVFCCFLILLEQARF